MTPRTRTRAARYTPADAVAHRRIEGQTLLLSADEEGLLTLNVSGEFIWRRVVLGRDVDAIARAFQRQFRLSPEIAARDVRAFLNMLLRRRLIRRA